MTPILKWAGSKRQLVPEILSRLPARIPTYYEPFLGGGAVFFALASERRFRHAIIGDRNEELMFMYSMVRDAPGAVVHALKEHVYEEKHYYEVRGTDPEKLRGAARAARFIYLNKTCFNGLYRVNRQGKFNVPFGRYTNPTICDDEGIRAASEALASATVLASLDFESLLLPARKGDVAYMDPPYAPLSETSNFTAYSAGGFGPAEQERLRDCFARLDSRGVHVLLSNSDTPLIRKLYEGFRIEEVKARRAINSKGDRRGSVGELLISGRNG